MRSGERGPRVVHVIHTTAFGGGTTTLNILCQQLSEEFSFSVVSDGLGDAPDVLVRAGVNIYELPLTSKSGFVCALPRLGHLLRELQPALIHLHGQYAGSFARPVLLGLRKTPTVYSVQWPAYLSDTGALTKVRNWLVEYISCNSASAVVAVSDSDRNALIHKRLTSPTKTQVIHNGVAQEFMRASDLSGERDNVVRFFGRLAAQKGVDVLLEALAVVLPQHREWSAEIVGDGPERARLERLAARLGLESRVNFIGYIPDPGPLMRRTSITAVPSRFEPFGIVAVEAMACGSVVVASRVGGLAEIVQNAETGLLSETGNVSDLAACLELLIRDSGLRDALASAGRSTAITRFSADAMAASYRSLYGRLLNR